MEHQVTSEDNRRSSSLLTPKQPLLPCPNLHHQAGASSSAAAAAAFPSSWEFRPSLPKSMRLLLGVGALGAAGAFLYSASNPPSGDAGGLEDSKKASNNTKESSELGARSPFFNRIHEQEMYNTTFESEPETVTVLVGPQSCGKSVSSVSFFQIS